MKKTFLLLAIAIAALVGCKSLNEDVIPKTSLESTVTAPARILTHGFTMKAIVAMIENGSITDAKSLKAAIKELRKVKTPGSRQKVLTTIGYASPKNTAADVINVLYNPTNAVFSMYITNLVTSTDPSVVIAAGDAQATVTGAEGEAFAKAGQVGVDMIKGLKYLTPAGQVGSVIPHGGVVVPDGTQHDEHLPPVPPGVK